MDQPEARLGEARQIVGDFSKVCHVRRGPIERPGLRSHPMLDRLGR
jgi:hypothetical protein